MQYLVSQLNEASKSYYQFDKEIMSNFEYDALYDELLELEKETGIVLANSPTQKVGYEIVSELEKETHESPMLSLDKTKDREVLKEWLKDKEGLLSWKLDGLTVVLTYQDGRLVKAVTRGNGEIGEVITNNAKTFVNVPLQIPFQGELVLRGEAVISYSEFEKINDSISDADAKYKNPRNLCSGSVRQLNSEITAKRNVRFYAFSLVQAKGAELSNEMQERFLWLSSLGFDVVEFKKVTSDNVLEEIQYFADKIESYDIPSDGLVLTYNDIAYGISLGRTAKFPRNAMAFKWADEIASTHLLEIDWSPSRTGLINPVAVFEPVELEGTTVSRASLHNVSILEELELGIGDEITVYKANMIIPQVSENKTRSKGDLIIKKCPACGGETQVKEENGVRLLYCVNPLCQAKKSKRFEHFVSRNAMNIEGFSGATIDKFIDAGFLNHLSDVFELSKYREEMIQMEGFGERSYQKLMESIEAARHTSLDRFIYSLGILNIGLSNAKMICRAFHQDYDKLIHATKEELMEIEGIGEVIAQFFVDFMENEESRNEMEKVYSYLFFEEEEEREDTLKDQIFVITGSLTHFSNRDELKEILEKKGGKVTGSVSAKTTYLINNDITSNSSKNKKAKELGIPILTEEDVLKLLEGEL
ncbi:MAG: NAD-dependent DNA ligase LigA [Lachnospiraceae bacterium]|nr:NAD-dependent DNA ligase LigA [Lachnospiraceae bacterium]